MSNNHTFCQVLKGSHQLFLETFTDKHQQAEVGEELCGFTRSHYRRPSLLHRSPNITGYVKTMTRHLIGTNQVEKVTSGMHNSESLSCHSVARNMREIRLCETCKFTHDATSCEDIHTLWKYVSVRGIRT